MLLYKDCADIDATVHEFVYGPVKWVRWSPTDEMMECSPDYPGSFPLDAGTDGVFNSYMNNTDDALRAAGRIVRDGKASHFKLLADGSMWWAEFQVVYHPIFYYKAKYASEAICGAIIRMIGGLVNGKA